MKGEKNYEPGFGVEVGKKTSLRNDTVKCPETNGGAFGTAQSSFNKSHGDTKKES